MISCVRSLQRLGCFRLSQIRPFLKVDERGVVIALVHVDDTCVASDDLELVRKVKEAIGQCFKIRDLREAQVFLGMDIRQEKDGDIVLSQSRYVEQILERHDMLDAKGRATPLAMGTRATPVTDEGELLEDPTPYRALVGELNYLAVSTRPDLAYALSILSRSMTKPTRAAMSVAKGVLRYLAGTREMVLRFPGRQGLQLDGYSDSDWAGDTVTCRSTTGYVFRVNGTAISWSSQLQRTVAALSVEAEYQALTSVVREALWLSKLSDDLKLGTPPSIIKVDSQGAMNISNNPMTSQRSKHIDVMHHLVRERVASGEVELRYCPTEKMVADVMTKALGEAKFKWCRASMGVA
ncbi:hypothetical protein Vafri_11858 [Volvox africanus]|uniref:Reverse transcriptase Ty1/copia-type domain-containing protein n=1 Tax=Volvox africanus TaxID=51714 RepID=A0A8J4BDK4_9CHLO|nr:hypothetical protein Vafri_11858 [Volvox africanus]